MKKFFKYCIKVNDLYVRLLDYGDIFHFTTDPNEAYLFYTFEDALKTVRKIYFDEYFAYPAIVLIERVELN